MNTLPIEIETRIWREYWIHEFRSKVLQEITYHEQEINKINRFFRYDKLKLQTQSMYIYYYEKYSKYLEELYNKKWPRLYFQNNAFPILNLIFEDEYIHYHINLIKSQYLFIALFATHNCHNIHHNIIQYFRRL